MKKLYQYTMILLAGVLGACSSLEVSEPYSDSFPAGFTAQTYMQLHPILRKLQIKDYVEMRNSLVKDSVTNAGGDYAALKAADDATFAASPTLVQICSDPFMGGYPVDACAAAATDANILKDLTEFNFVGVADDFTVLTQVPVDEVAISQQYIVYGESHGWAYRFCDATELANITRDQVTVSVLNAQGIPVDSSITKLQEKTVDDPKKFVADPGHYCMDPATGILHLVNQ
jgi:hypothetical protein